MALDWEKLREEIRDAFRGYAPDTCKHCGASLQKEVLAVENKFVKHIDALIRHYLEPPGDRVEAVKKILDEPVTCEDGRSHYIDENNKRYLSSLICQLPVKVKLPLLSNEEITKLVNNRPVGTSCFQMETIVEMSIQAQLNLDKESLVKAGFEVEE